MYEDLYAYNKNINILFSPVAYNSGILREAGEFNKQVGEDKVRTK